jgi:hypothetical protein
MTRPRSRIWVSWKDHLNTVITISLGWTPAMGCKIYRMGRDPAGAVERDGR